MNTTIALLLTLLWLALLAVLALYRYLVEIKGALREASLHLGRATAGYTALLPTLSANGKRT